MKVRYVVVPLAVALAVAVPAFAQQQIDCSQPGNSAYCVPGSGGVTDIGGYRHRRHDHGHDRQGRRRRRRGQRHDRHGCRQRHRGRRAGERPRVARRGQ